MIRIGKSRSCALFLGAALFPLSSAHAQTAEPGAAEGGIEDIIVTAQRRAESLQDVPIAVTAISGTGLQTRGITEVTALSNATPGLQLNIQRSSLTPYLRGVGTQNGGVGEEGSIATYIDGVYYAALSGQVFSFNNIERVEVLKGPQGTLFGRNATGGLIQVITKDPGHTPMVQGSFEYANYDTKTASVYATAGLSDTIAIDIAGFWTDQGKGWGHNVSGKPTLDLATVYGGPSRIVQVDGIDVNYRDEWAVRSKLLFEPNDALRITLSGDYNHRESDVGNYRQVLRGARLQQAIPATSPNPPGATFRGTIYDVQAGIPRDVRFHTYGGSAKVELDIGGATVTSTTAYRKFFNFGLFDQDGGPANIVTSVIRERTKTFQQELLLTGETDSFDYTAGLFYFYSKAGFAPLGQRGNAPSMTRSRYDRISTQDTHSYAAFVQGTWHATPTTDITAGLRFTRDKRKIIGQDIAIEGNVAGPTDPVFTPGTPIPVGTIFNTTNGERKANYNKLTWRFAVDQKLNDDILAYATYSRGFKSGIYNNTNPYAPPVDPETLDAYEVGLKSDLIGHQLRVNLSGFYYRYKNIQLTAIDAGVTRTYNAAEARVKGAELEIVAAPPVAEGSLEFRAGLSYLDGEYNKFNINGICFTPRPAPLGGNVATPCDLTGNTLIRTPPVTVNLALDYQLPVGEAGTLGFNISSYFNSGFYFEPDNRVRQDDYTLLNAQISFTAPDDRWRLSVFARNITKTEYYSGFSQGAVGDQASPGAPRTYGVSLGFKFGG